MRNLALGIVAGFVAAVALLRPDAKMMSVMGGAACMAVVAQTVLAYLCGRNDGADSRRKKREGVAR